MNNLSLKLKKLLGNKNVVTALCFIIIGVVLIFGYNMRVNQATSPVKVPYALKTISPQTKITEDMIGTMEVARDSVNKVEGAIILDKRLIVGKYVNLESTIYEGSFFYTSAVSTTDDLPTSPLLKMADNQTLVSLDVNMKTSYYNSIVPGDYVDLYVRTIGKLGKDDKVNEILVGKLIAGIKVLAVKDENGQNVFGTDEKRTPAGVIFAVPEEQYLLIKKADYFTKLQDVAEIQFVLVPRGKKYQKDDGTEITSAITSEQLQEYINDKTKDIDVNEIINNNNGQVNNENNTNNQNNN